MNILKYIFAGAFSFIVMAIALPCMAFDVPITKSEAQNINTIFTNTSFTPAVTFWSSVNLGVNYNVGVKNMDTGDSISAGSKVKCGTNIKLGFLPSDGSWTFNGWGQDTPNVKWGTTDSACAGGNYMFPADYYNSYGYITATPPSVKLNNTSGMSCGAVTGNSTSGYYANCKITGTGSLNPQFYFAPITNSFNYSFKCASNSQCVLDKCYGNYPLGAVALDAKAINYNLISEETVTLTASPSLFISSSGGSTTLTWNTNGATCTANAVPANIAWVGSKSSTTNQTTTASVSATTTFSLDCPCSSAPAIVTVIKPIPGQCGTAATTPSGTHALYAYTGSTDVFSSTQLCSAGSSYNDTGVTAISSATLPAFGGASVAWTCKGQDYGATAYCAAKRADVPYPVTASCSGSPLTPRKGEAVKWTAIANGGNGTYTYKWNNNITFNNLLPTTTSAPIKSGTYETIIASGYATDGGKTATVTVTSNGVSVTSAQCSVGVNRSVVAACYGSPGIAATGTEIIWQAVAGGGDGAKTYTYSWTGDNGLSGSESTKRKTYTAADGAGKKWAHLTVMSTDGGSATADCSVDIFLASVPVTASCYVPATSIPYKVVNWTAQGGGGNGIYTYKWNNVGANTLPTTTSAPTELSYVTPWYPDSVGQKTAYVTVTSNGVSKNSANCSTIAAYPPITASCSVPATSTTLNPVTWTATGGGGNEAYTYTWVNVSGSNLPTTTSANTGYTTYTSSPITYTTIGEKSAKIKVTSNGSSTISATCSTYVTIPGICNPEIAKPWFTGNSFGTSPVKFCNSGTPNPAVPTFPSATSQPTPFVTTWTCEGSGIGHTSETCVATFATNGVCGSAAKQYSADTKRFPNNAQFCSSGTPSPITPAFPDASKKTISTPYLWVVNSFYPQTTVVRIDTTKRSIDGGAMTTYTLKGVKSTSDIAVDACENVWVTDNGWPTVPHSSSTWYHGGWIYYTSYNNTNYMLGNYITKFDPAGNQIGKYTYPYDKGPAGIAIDAFGNILVVNDGGVNVNGDMCLDTPGTTVTKLDSAGNFIKNYNLGPLNRGITVDVLGNIWVNNGGDYNHLNNGNWDICGVGDWVYRNSVTKISPSGSIFVYDVGGDPYLITADSLGNIWVSVDIAMLNGDHNYSIKKLNLSGTIINSYSLNGYPTDIAADNAGSLWVVENYNSFSVVKIGTGSNVRIHCPATNYPKPADYWPEQDQPTKVELDASGNIWVTCRAWQGWPVYQVMGKNVIKFDPSGNILDTYNVGASYDFGPESDGFVAKSVSLANTPTTSWSCNGSNGGTSSCCLATLVNQPPYVSDFGFYPNYCDVGSGAGLISSFGWKYHDLDGNTESRYQFQLSDSSSFSSTIIDYDSKTGLSNPSGSSNNYPAQIYVSSKAGDLAFNKTYYWRVKVYDSYNADSGWSAVQSFTTPVHSWPNADFVKPSVYINKPALFTNSSTCYGDSCGYTWTFGDGTTSYEESPVHTYSTVGSKRAVLMACDNDFTRSDSNPNNGCCATLADITVRAKAPEWKEISPF